jgi:excisionase family DNA binding protein
MRTDKHYMVMKEVAPILRLSLAKAYELAEKGALPVIRPAGTSRILVDPDDLEAYLDAGRTGNAKS